MFLKNYNETQTNGRDFPRKLDVKRNQPLDRLKSPNIWVKWPLIARM